MTPATSIWLAARGSRTDRIRVVATATVAALAVIVLLGAASVSAISDQDGPYPFELLTEPGLRAGLVLTIAILSVPLVALMAQCSRIGAAERDRRLAAFRLAGATGRDTRLIAGAETALAGALGAILGAGAFAGLRRLLDPAVTTTSSYERQRIIEQSSDTTTVVTERHTGQVHLLPTDVDIQPIIVMALIALVPLVAGAFTLLVLRRVNISPFGVVRLEGVRTPRMAPAVMFVVGTAGLAGFPVVRSAAGLPDDAQRPVVVLVFGLAAMVVVGLLLGTAAMAQSVGSLIANRSRRASMLIAGRRLDAHPFTASRINSVILLVVLIGGFIQGLREYILATTSPEETFYADTLNLTNVALAVAVALSVLGVLVVTGETAVTGRRTFAGLVASGVPRSALRQALLLETVLPLLPMAVLAAVAGVFGARGVFGTQETESLGTAANETLRVIDVPIPWAGTSALVIGTVAVAALMAVLAVGLVKPGADPEELRTTA